MKNYIIVGAFLMHNAMYALNESYSVKLLMGPEIQSVLPFIAQERLTAFREYPYLYHGTLKSEKPYLELYSRWKDAAVALAYCGDVPVGLLTAMPLYEFDQHCKKAVKEFKKKKLQSELCYYLSEVIIKPEHRRKGLCSRLFKVMEEHARSLGYATATFLTVNREENHPQKPAGYTSQEPLWLGLGYTKTSMTVNFTWSTIKPQGKLKKQDHTLTFWIKNLVSGSTVASKP